MDKKRGRESFPTKDSRTLFLVRLVDRVAGARRQDANPVGDIIGALAVSSNNWRDGLCNALADQEPSSGATDDLQVAWVKSWLGDVAQGG